MNLQWLQKHGHLLPPLVQALQALQALIRPLPRFYTQRPSPIASVLAGLRIAGSLSSYHEGRCEPGIAQILTQLIRPIYVCVDAGANMAISRF